MPRSTKHYDTLGIKPDASMEDIKKSFRKKAKDCHPDHHPGDAKKEKEFKQLAIAYTILSDSESRKRYDTTGEEEPQASNPKGQIYEAIIHVFNEVRKNEGDNIFYIDLIQKIISVFDMMITTGQGNARKLQQEDKKIKRLMGKIKYAEGNDRSFIHTALSQERQQNRIQLVGIRRNIQTFRKAKEMLKSYRFEADKREARWDPAGMFGGSDYFTIEYR